MPPIRAAIESDRKPFGAHPRCIPGLPSKLHHHNHQKLPPRRRLFLWQMNRGSREPDEDVAEMLEYVSLQGHLPTERTNLRENLRDCYRDLIRWDALHTAGINGLYYIAITNTTHDGIVYIDQPQSRRRVYQPKRSAACRPINVVPCHRIKGTGGRIPTEIYLMCDCGACTVQRDYCYTSVGRVAIDCDLSRLGSGCGWLEL